MREVTIEARTRAGSGKGVARKLRAARKIPAVVYGKGEQPVAIELEYDSFHTAMRKVPGENLLVNLYIDGADSGKKALIKDVQRDPINGSLLHIDFQHISMTEKIRVEVPVVLQGIPVGVKTFGGIISWVVRHLEVSCLPKDIPDKITVDVSELKIHDSLHVRDIKLENVDIVDNPEQTVVSIVPPTVIKEEAPAETAEAAAAAAVAVEGEEPAEPEVITEKKAEERKAEREKEKEKEKGKERGEEKKKE